MGPVPEPAHTLIASLALSALAYYQTATLVPLLGPQLVAKGLGGVDMLKPGFVRDEAPTGTTGVAAAPTKRRGSVL